MHISESAETSRNRPCEQYIKGSGELTSCLERNRHGDSHSAAKISIKAKLFQQNPRIPPVPQKLLHILGLGDTCVLTAKRVPACQRLKERVRGIQ